MTDNYNSSGPQTLFPKLYFWNLVTIIKWFFTEKLKKLVISWINTGSLKEKKHVTLRKKELKIQVLSRSMTFYHSSAYYSSWSSLKWVWIYILPLFCTVDIPVHNAPASYYVLHNNWWIRQKENDWPKVISLFSCLKKDHVLPLSNPGTLSTTSKWLSFI